MHLVKPPAPQPLQILHEDIFQFSRVLQIEDNGYVKFSG